MVTESRLRGLSVTICDIGWTYIPQCSTAARDVID